jgi:signal transduction histidine kinase
MLVSDVAWGQPSFTAARDLLAVTSAHTVAVVFFGKSDTQVSDQINAFKLGAVDFILLPQGPSILAARLVSHLARMRRFRDLRAPLEQAQHLSFSHASFLAHLGHELKTPLNSILGFSQILLEEKCGPLNERQRKYVTNIRGGGQELLGLFDRMLELVGTQSRGASALSEAHSPSEGAEAVLQLLREKQFRHRLQVESDLSDDAQLKGDPVVFRRMVFHLLLSAMKLTPDGGLLRLRGQREGCDYALTLECPDFPTEGLERLSQGGMADRNSPFQSSVVPALLRGLAESQGGRFTTAVENGHGARFQFFFPLELSSASGSRPQPPCSP